MILTLDIGNTTVGVGIAEPVNGDYSILFGKKLTLSEKQPDYYNPLKELLKASGISSENIEGAVLSSVVPFQTESMISAVEKLIGTAPMVISHRDCHMLKFAVPQPEKLGTDRLADSAWAAAHYSLPLVTADLGTAATFNVIDENGIFLGGIIAAGAETALKAISSRGAQLPAVKLLPPKQLIGKNTEECMQSGAVIGMAAMTDGIAARAEKELGRAVTLILTGGCGELISPYCLYPHVYDPYLLIKGLAFLYDRNK